MPRDQLVIIGSEGFIGKAIVRSIIGRSNTLELGEIVGTSRGGARSSNGYRIVHLDLENLDAPRPVFDRAKYVVHCARDSDGGDTEPAGLRALLQACKRDGVQFFVYFSSVSVYGTAQGQIHETATCRPNDRYGICKYEAEKICREEATDKFHIAVLRPSHVYGPEGSEWTTKYIRDLERNNLFLRKNSNSSPASLVFVDDVANFCADLIKAAPSGFSIYNVDGNLEETWDDYFQKLSSGLGFGVLTKSVSRPKHRLQKLFRKVVRKLLKALLEFLRKISWPVADKVRSLYIVDDILTQSCRDENCDQDIKPSKYIIDRAVSCGFRPAGSLDEGIEKIKVWYKSNASNHLDR